MFKFYVVPDEGEPYDVESKTRDIVVWEKSKAGRTVSQLVTNGSMTSYYELAHITAKRLGKTTQTLHEFMGGVDLEVTPTEEEDPTQPTP
jgi:hypothetical protein